MQPLYSQSSHQIFPIRCGFYFGLHNTDLYKSLNIVFTMDSGFSSTKLEIWECFIVFTLFEQVQRYFFS